MRVLITPYFDGNQYQNLLIDAVEAEGASVVTDDSPHPLSLFILQIIAEDIDVLHLHWTHPFFLLPDEYGERFNRLPLSFVGVGIFAAVFLLQVAVASLFCDRIVWTLHNEMNHERMYPRIDRSVASGVARLSDVIQVWDDGTRRKAASFLPVSMERIVPIPHGHYCDLYPDIDELPPKSTTRNRLGIDPENFVFLYFGRIRAYKQVPDLIRAFQRLDLDDATLLIAGTPESDELEEEIRETKQSDAVMLTLEYVPDENVPKLFRAADVAVFPYSHSFNSGSVLLAMSLSRAFIAPPYGAIPSIDPGGNIIYEELERGLRDAYEQGRSSLHGIGTTNQEYVLKHHTWTEIGTQMTALYGSSTTITKGINDRTN